VYAIIEDSGTQIKVSPGDVLEVDPRSDLKENAKNLTFDRVLAVGDGESAATVGTPYVEGATVKAEILDPAVKGEKIDVIKFKRRKGYRRKAGHRQPYLRVRIGDIKN
ncbi:MAG TPA: 50S ribosomal protein L21, partial [Gammaproteobacteria bacterium]|nr:50S ribosomal protein L21 [Gammaproteobacteria bacterium]